MMFSKETLTHLTLRRAATFRITIRGRLDESWAEQLGCGAIQVTQVEHTIYATTLTGQFADQAALFGVLNRLYNLGFPLFSVECIAVAPSKREGRQQG